MKKTLRCTYHYDPLNRLSAVQPERQSNGLRFYCQNRIVTSLHDNTQHSIMHTGDQVLAQQSHEAHDSTSTLLGTDAQRSVLHAVSGTKQQVFAYSPFGHTPAMQAHHLLGFNGERADPITGHYLLGNGYRAFNPVLMRFNSPDSWSPFGRGGINAYAYCAGDPINCQDPTGHVLNKILKMVPLPPPRPASTLSTKAVIANVPAQPQKMLQTPIGRRSSDVSDALKAKERLQRDPIINGSSKNDLVAFHGSTKQHQESLAAGLSAQKMGTRNGLDSGPGFYATPSFKSAQGWASTSKRAENSTPQVYGVYAKNFHSLKNGRDYTLSTELNTEIAEHIQIIFRESAYPALSIAPLARKNITIRMTSFEAPF